MKTRKIIQQLIAITVMLIVGCVLCGLGSDFGINTLLYPGIGFCVLSGVFLVLFIFKGCWELF